jgi:hypothetical protein
MMLEIRKFYGPTDWGWVLQHVPMKRVEDTCGMMAIDEDKNETVGAVILDNFLNNSVQATIILKNSLVLRHDFLEEAFELIFHKLDKKFIYVLVAENNTASLRLSHKLGFVEKMRIRDGYLRGIDFVVKELDRENSIYYNKLSEVA